MASTRVGGWASRAGHAAGRGRRGFRRWRRGRPFWGGLFTILGGAEILLLPALGLPLLIQVGIAGISGLIAGTLIVVMGLAAWFAPHYRVFAGVATILFSLASFLTSNLGGFLLGMLLGLLGGSLCCAWVPIRPRARPQDAEPAPGPAPADPDTTGPSAPEPADAAQAESVPAEPVRQEAAQEDAVPAESAPSAPSGPSGPDGTAGAAESRSLRTAGWGLPLPVLLAVPWLLAAALAGPVPGPRPAAASAPTVTSVGPTMHASTVDMSALSFHGVVEVPTRRGPLRVLEFSMGRIVMHDYSLDVPPAPDAGGSTLSIGTLTLASDVTFYTTRMSGLLAGTVPVTFTPDAPPPLVPPALTFTDFSSEQVFVSSDRLTATGLVLRPDSTA
ncbi:MAG TPA: DUF6114 domain-containing protein [Mycobacteriales bacterium]|nr:DUF6114 domain-containing protein [Mycobacteriales bacterium]